MKITGKHVFITGASRGVGYHVAQTMIDRGARVTSTARDTERLYTPAKEVGFEPVAADLTDFEQLCSLAGRAEDMSGPIDILINNAGINIPGVLAHQNEADLRTVVNTNLLAPLILTKQVRPHMLDVGQGAILNVSSGTGEMAMRNVIPYGSTKTGLTMYDLLDDRLARVGSQSATCRYTHSPRSSSVPCRSYASSGSADSADSSESCRCSRTCRPSPGACTVIRSGGCPSPSGSTEIV